MVRMLEIMRARHAVVLVLFLATLNRVDAAESFVGREVPPGPPGCEHKEGGILGDLDRFAYEVFDCKEAGEVALLERFVERRGKLAYWQVIDELRLPAPTRDGLARLDVPFCRSSAYKGSHVLAIGAWKEVPGGAVAERISHAWRFNLESRRIESIPVKGVACDREDID